MQTVRVFVSYSHRDRNYLGSGQLVGYLRGLETDSVEFWSDEQITAGAKWDEEIQHQIGRAHVALVLVSQAYLDSAYCQNVEIVKFLENAEKRGLIIIPVLLSPCEIERHAWLRERQFIPSGSSIESHYKTPSRRKQLYHEIRQHLRKQIERLRGEVLPPIVEPAPLTVRVWCQHSDSPKRSRDISVIGVEHRQQFRVGDTIVVGVQADADCEIALVNVGSSGHRKVLLPNQFSSVARAKAGEACWFPSDVEGFEFRLTGPPGVETILAYAGEGPLKIEAAADNLSESERPKYAEARCYLEVAAG